jgi:hypothetical protein
MSRTIDELREMLFQTMEDLKAGRIDIETARCTANLGQVIVNSAVAEVKFLKDNGGSGTGFMAKGEVVKNAASVKQISGKREETLSEHEKTLRKYGV